MNNLYLFPGGTFSFDSNGLGPLDECRNAKCIKELNGPFEIEFEYPTTGNRTIEYSQIVLAHPFKGKGWHPFLIDRIEKVYDDTLKIHASHLSSLLNGVILNKLKYDKNHKKTPAQIISAMYSAVMEKQIPAFSRQGVQFPIPTSYFELKSDDSITDTKTFVTDTPCSFKAVMGDTIDGGSLLSVFGGEYDYDPVIDETGALKNKCTIWLRKEVGRATDVVIKYGYNMTEFELEEDYSDVFTDIIPFYKNGSSYVEGSLVSTEKTFPFARVMMADVTNAFSKKPTKTTVTEEGAKYFKKEKIDVPALKIEVKTGYFEEQDIDTGDYITVIHSGHNYEAMVRCTKIESDIRNEIITSYEFETTKKDVSEIIAKAALAGAVGVSKSSDGLSGNVTMAMNDDDKIYERVGDASDDDPLMDGEASAGESALYSRGDHRHPSNSAKLAVNATMTNAEIDNILSR